MTAITSIPDIQKITFFYEKKVKKRKQLIYLRKYIENGKWDFPPHFAFSELGNGSRSMHKTPKLISYYPFFRAMIFFLRCAAAFLLNFS